jgi:hypothetical protein
MGTLHYFFGFMIGIGSANLDANRREEQLKQWYNNYSLRTYASQEFMKAYSNPQLEWRLNR